jgi:hypothetical protein
MDIRACLRNVKPEIPAHSVKLGLGRRKSMKVDVSLNGLRIT